MSQVWLDDLVNVLRKAKIQVVPMRYESGRYAGKTWAQVGAENQGYAELRGVMWHHDASPVGDSGRATIDANGFGTRPTGALWWCMYDGFGWAPAAAIWVDRYGKWYVYAAGRTNHAGVGNSTLTGLNNGNATLLGIETDHGTGEDWPDAQISSLRAGTAAIMRHYKLDPTKALIGHKEYAPGRKNDPDGLNMDIERRRVARLASTPQNGWRALLTKWFGRKG
jgi:hypothetical protein